MMHKILLFLCITAGTQFTFAQSAISVKIFSTKGDPMIFLPHIGCSSDMWREMAENFKNTHACFLVDFAGFAGMAPLPGNYTGNYVKELSSFIKEKQLRNCILVGQNYGGYVAVKVAEALPKRMKALVLSDFYPKLSMVLDKNISQGKLDTILTSIKTFYSTADSAQFFTSQKQTAEAMNFNKADMVNKFVNWQLWSDRFTLSETLITQMKDNLLPYFTSNTIPTLAFSTWYFAKKYKNMPLTDAQKTLDDYYPGSKMVTYAITETSKDFIANDEPEWFAEQLNQFLKINAGAH